MRPVPTAAPDAPFVIVGAGGLGRELLGWIAGCGEATRQRYRVQAFVAEQAAPGETCHGLPVLRPQAFEGAPPRYVIAIADTAAKRRIAQALDALGWTAEVFVHDSANVGLNAVMGPGTIICPCCRISTDSRIGAHVLVNSSCGVGHDAVVGDYCSLLGNVAINGHVEVGEGVLFGAGSMVHPGKSVGDWATVGLGSVVLRRVPAHATVFGNPARLIDDGATRDGDA
jgi:acetyltransferase EpsM